MSNSCTFILPRLFDNYARHYLDAEQLSTLNQLVKLLSKSKKKKMSSLTHWFNHQLSVPTDYANSANVMALSEGIASLNDNNNCRWLRADPIILSVTHNGLFCRGNRVLEITSDERTSLEKLVNDYFNKFFNEHSIELILTNYKSGYIKLNSKIDCQFVPLEEVMGNDISPKLPFGDNAKFWHGIFTDLQMLLHNCDVNKQRISVGMPTISGFWIWAETHVEVEKERNHKGLFYSDDAALSGAINRPVSLPQLEKQFLPIDISGDITLHVSEFSQALNQNDEEGWRELYQQWVVNWLIPAIKAVDNNELSTVSLITDDGYCYQYNSKSSWCFWRNHKQYDEEVAR